MTSSLLLDRAPEKSGTGSSLLLERVLSALGVYPERLGASFVRPSQRGLGLVF